ncbi:exodeoxyribonuclease VII large subunit [Lutibaculum baratangense]|nr:exodeoxyribonuclease VII large subunit [Lutibaculum baratangense]
MNEQTNLPEITVGELSLSIKRTMEDAFPYVRVRGEIFNYKGPHASGHAYFCLKDSQARIDAIVWRTAMPRLKFKPEEGLEVVATGKISTYPGRSSYQLIIEQLEPAGAGALMALLEERKKTLAAEGLFAEERKRPIPYLPRVIGVVTSPTGAVIRDILHRLTDRLPTHVLVWPSRVQGEGAAEQVAAAIRGFNALAPDGALPRPDVLIVARGGGSLEDLWCFNEEIVVRAAAESGIPLISAVGHETDWTLIDLASDVRAPTPTAAAEMAVPVRAELAAIMEDRSRRLWGSLSRLVQERRNQLRAAERGLPRLSDLLAMPRQRLDTLWVSLPMALRNNTRQHRNRLDVTRSRLSRRHLDERIVRARERVEWLGERKERAEAVALQRRREVLDRLAGLLSALSHEKTLERGFALVYRQEGSLIHRAGEGRPGEEVRLKFADGEIGAKLDGEEPPPRPARGSKPKSPRVPAKQTDLFDE